jgi:hypothetical protein
MKRAGSNEPALFIEGGFHYRLRTLGDWSAYSA